MDGLRLDLWAELCWEYLTVLIIIVTIVIPTALPCDEVLRFFNWPNIVKLFLPQSPTRRQYEYNDVSGPASLFASHPYQDVLTPLRPKKLRVCVSWGETLEPVRVWSKVLDPACFHAMLVIPVRSPCCLRSSKSITNFYMRSHIAKIKLIKD